jgi:hypothetical protein
METTLERPAAPAAFLDVARHDAPHIPSAELVPVYQEIAGQQEQIPKKRLVRDVETKAPYAIVSSSYTVVQHGDLLNAAMEALDKIGVNAKPKLTLYRGGQLKASFVFGDATVPVAVGDIIQPQLILFNSYDLSMNYGFSLGALRLVCLNGLTATTRIASLRRKHIGAISSMIDPGYLTTLIESFYSTVLPRWQRATTIEITPERVTEIYDNAPFPKGIIERASKVFGGRLALPAAERPSTAWTVYNSFTNAITHYKGFRNKGMSIEKERGYLDTADALLIKLVGE